MRTTLAVIAAVLLSSAPALAQEVSANATLIDQSGTVLGTLTLTEEENGVRIAGELTSVPNGEHGFHIHETGTCDPETKFESAGGHFNPENKKHGFDNPDGPHAGDMRNVTADADGNVAIDVVNEMLALSADAPNSLADTDGAAIMIHSGPDDYATDPGGDAGDRFACGIVEFAQ